MEWIKVKQEHMSPEYTNYEVGILVRYQFLVATLKRVPSDKEVKLLFPVKRLQILEKKILNLYQIDMKTIANRVLIDVKSVEDVRQYEKDRKRRYRSKQALSHGTAGDSPPVEKIREDKIRERGVPPLHKTRKYLISIPDEDIKKMINDFIVTKDQIIKKGKDLYDWCLTNGKNKSQYRSFLLGTIRKDFAERTEEDRKKVVLVPKRDSEGQPITRDGVVVMVEK